MEINKIFTFNQNLLKSVLLLVLAVSGNFVGNTLGCKTQYHMTNNMYVKHALLIFITFFTLNYTASENEYPLQQIIRAFMIWFCYLLFTKQSILFTGISASFLVLTYIIDTFATYYKKKSEEENKNDNLKISDKLDNLKNYSFNLGIITILAGFILYMRDKQIEYKNDFDIFTFVFGKTTCKSLQ